MSVSRSVLNLVDNASDNFRLMPVWHTNVEDPTSVRRSTIPVLPEPPLQDVPMVETEGEDFVATVPVVDSVPKRPKRKQGDGVSSNLTRANGSPLI